MSELALPSPDEVYLAQVPAIASKAALIRARCLAEGDVEGARELQRQLAALTRYVADKRVRAALEGEQRLAEMLIGQLLGPVTTPGQRTDLLPGNKSDDVNTRHRVEFRRMASAPERVQELVDSGVTQRSQILRRLEHDERSITPPPLQAVGEFPVLLADPPWRYDFAETRNRAIENQYPTMTLDDLQALEPPATDDAVIYMWATSPKLIEALATLKAWRFQYLTNLVWVKDRVGMGYWARQRHELLLVGVRGHFSPPLAELRPDSVIEAPRGSHSEKPAAAHELIERCWPGVAKVELFARQPRDGWSAWGHEVGEAA